MQQAQQAQQAQVGWQQSAICKAVGVVVGVGAGVGVGKGEGEGRDEGVRVRAPAWAQVWMVRGVGGGRRTRVCFGRSS